MLFRRYFYRWQNYIYHGGSYLYCLYEHPDTIQTSMFVPDPVISLSIRPEGTETPNFSRALNRFQKEDPTFRVHVDGESKEVSGLVYLFEDMTDLEHRLSSPEWESCISRST